MDVILLGASLMIFLFYLKRLIFYWKSLLEFDLAVLSYLCDYDPEFCLFLKTFGLEEKQFLPS